MKKLLAAIAALGLVLIVIAVFRTPPAGPAPPVKEQSYSPAEQENIRQFWRHYRKATQYRISGQLQQALDEYEMAIGFNANHEDALYYAGNIYRDLGDRRKAIDCWKTLVALNPQSTRTHLQLGDIYLDPEAGEGFDPKAAEAEYRRALEINGEASKVLLRLGQVALVNGDLEAAGEQFAALAGTGKTGITAGFLMGYVEWKQGLKHGALTSFKNAVAHSIPEKSADGFSREGDTNNAKAPDAPPDPKYNILSNVDLGALADVDPSQLTSHMDAKYRELDEYLANLGYRLR